MSEAATGTRVIKVAVRVTTDIRTKDLSAVLDETFEGWGGVVQFAVEGYGWDGNDDPPLEADHG
jgi:hypothetical protein